MGQKKQNKYLSLIIGVILLVLALGISYTLSSAKSEKIETKTDNIYVDKFSNLKINKSSSIVDLQIEDKLISQAAINNEWISEVFKPNFPFDALGAQWRKDKESDIKISVRFSKDNKAWENWQEMVVDDADQGKENSESAQTRSLEISDLTFSSQAQYFQYKVAFEDKIEQAYLESIIFSYINASDNSTIKTLSNLFRPSKAKAVNSPHVISRAEWGAEPSWMTWPPEYVRPTKIIIHHTASGNNPPDPAAVVRSIYYYHAVSLGWGDIGYNYLFDQNGNIYEGRAGGNMAVGAHTYGQNYGSIGLSVIGDFSSTDITAPTLGSLTDMTAYKAYENDFDITFGTIFGHRDFCNNPPGHNCTACPGDVLYNRKGEIIDNSRAKVSTYLQRDRDFLNQNNNVLVKSYSEPTVYLWQDGKRKPIANPATFAMFGYSWSNINYLSLLALNEKPQGELISALAKTAVSPNVFLLGQNPAIKYFIPDMATFLDFGFKTTDIIEKTSTELDSYPTINLKKIIKAPDSPVVYLIENGVKRPFADPLAFYGWGYDFSQVLEMKSSFVNIYASGQPLYYLVRADNNPAVYLLKQGIKCFIPNPNLFMAWGFNWQEISLVSPEELAAWANGPEIKRIAKESAPAIYLADQNKKFSFANEEMLNRWGEISSSVFAAPDGLLSRLADGGEIKSLAKGPGATIYLLFSGKKYPFLNWESFIAWGLNINQVTLLNIAPETIPQNNGLSRLIKGSSNTVYSIEAGKKRAIADWSTFLYYNFNPQEIVGLPDELVNSLPDGEPLIMSPLIKGSAPTVYYLWQGTKMPISDPATFLAWGFQWNEIKETSDAALNFIPQGASLSILVKKNTPSTVYLIHGGHKRPIDSSLTFKLWDFQSESISVLPDALIDELTTDNALYYLVKGTGETIYLMNQGKKMAVSNELFGHWGFSLNSLTQLDDAWLNNLPNGNALTNLAKGQTDTVYLLENGRKRAFSSLAAFSGWGYSTNNITLTQSELLEPIPSGEPISKYLIKGSTEIIYVLDQGKKMAIADWDTFVHWGFDLNNDVLTLTDQEISLLPDGGRLTRTPQINGEIWVYYLILSKRKVFPDYFTFSAYGYNVSDISLVSRALLESRAFDGEVPKETDILDGIWIPATSGKVGREQHLWLFYGQSEGEHYAISGTPDWAQNGMAGSFGSFGSVSSPPDINNERYYVNMRWNYTEWYEAPDGTCTSHPDGHLDTCYRNSNLALKAWHRSKRVIITNPRNGRKIVASIEETGPAIWTGRVSGLSPEAMGALETSTNDNLIYHWAAGQFLNPGPINF